MLTFKSAAICLTVISYITSSLAVGSRPVQKLNFIDNPMFEHCNARTPEEWTMSTTSLDSNCGQDNDLKDYYNQGGSTLLTQHLDLIYGHRYSLSFQLAFHGKGCKKGYASLTLESGTGGITVNGNSQRSVCQANGKFVTFTGTVISTSASNAVQVHVGSPQGYYLVTDIKVIDLGLCPSAIPASRKKKIRAGIVDVPYWVQTRVEKRSVDHKAADIAKRAAIAAQSSESTGTYTQPAKRIALPEMIELTERDVREAQAV